MRDWYYQEGSSYEGPVTVDDIRSLRAAGRIGDRTLVWSRSRGGEWTPLREAGIPSLALAPPALPSSVNNAYAWALASVPLLGLAIEWLIALSYPMLMIPDFWFLLGYAVVFIGLAMLDLEEISKADLDDRTFATALSILIAPVYLFVRSRLTSQPPLQLFAWIASTLAATVIILIVNR